MIEERKNLTLNIFFIRNIRVDCTLIIYWLMLHCPLCLYFIYGLWVIPTLNQRQLFFLETKTEIDREKITIGQPVTHLLNVVACDS